MGTLSDDQTLLRDFVEYRSQLAFAELVERHAGLVHSAALRQTRDRHLAEDVAQAVFLLLAKRAHKLILSPDVILSGWLYNTARYAGLAARRSAERRRRHEEKAAEQMNSIDNSSLVTLNWTDIEPIVDHAMSRLRSTERTALLLRYFENKPVKDVAVALHLSEDAAKRRCHRALDKLRRLVRLSAGATPALAELLSINAVHPAPAHVVVAASTLANIAPPVPITTLARGTVNMMIRSKLKSVLVCTVAVVATLGSAQWALTGAQAAAPVRAATPAVPAAPVVLPSQFAAGSPRAVFYEAYTAGITADAAHLRDLLLLDPADASLLDVPVASQGVFEAALKSKFANAPVIPDTTLPAAAARFVAMQMTGLDKFVEDTVGDESTIRQPNGFDFFFRKIDGHWKWDLTHKPALEADAKFKRATGQARIRLVYSMTKLTDIYATATRKLLIGGYASRGAALADVRSKFLVKIQETPPELRPPQPSFEPIVAIQTEDYAVVRSRFHTKLNKVGPAPDLARPTALPATPSDAVVIEYPSAELRLKGWLFTPPTTTATKHPALVHLHGGFSLHPDRWAGTQIFRDAGFVVLMPALRGENGQAGAYSQCYDEVDDVLAAAAFLKARPDVDPDRVFVVGYGDSAGIALLAAETSPAFRAASAISGLNDLLLICKYFPPAEIARFPFDRGNPQEFEVRSPLAYAQSLKCPARLFDCGAEPYLIPSDRRFAQLAREHNIDVTATTVKLPPKEAVMESLRQTLKFFRQRL